MVIFMFVYISSCKISGLLCRIYGLVCSQSVVSEVSYMLKVAQYAKGIYNGNFRRKTRNWEKGVKKISINKKLPPFQ